MGKTRTHVHSLNVGEVAVSALARIDQEKVRLAAETQENILGRVIGKGQFRPGTQYLGATEANNRGRILPFVKSVTDTALLELTTGKLRVWVADSLVTRPSVTSTVTNGTFASATGWTLTVTGGATASIASNVLTMLCPNRGGTSLAKQAVTTSSSNTEHALRIVVTRGKVLFRCGSSDGDDNYIADTELEEGIHSLSFTPTSSPYYIQFFSRSINQAIVSNCTVESSGVMSIDAPWSESDLRLIRVDQSQDVVFIACGSWQQRKIERRATRSWSLVKYKAENGPFTTARTAQAKLTPSVLSGSGTLTSDRPFFKSTHVGCLFRLFHEGQMVVTSIAAENEASDPIRIGTSADTADRTFDVTVSGTWSGTLRDERSWDSGTTGFIRYGTRTNGTVTLTETHVSNAIWIRCAFGPGDYTSGVATISMTHRGGGGHGICRVTGFTSSTQVDIEVLEPFLGTTSTAVWYEGEWSDRRGWPTGVAFHDGRLSWVRGTRLWLSESDDFYSFGVGDDESIVDSSPISRSIATSGSVDASSWLLSMQRLIIGTQGAEVAARSNSLDEPIKPTTTQLKDASTQGSAAISPAKVDKRGLYVQRAGNLLYELAYNFEQQDYDSSNLMEMHEYLGGDGLLEIAVQRQPDTYIWTVRADGQCPVMLYEPRQRVAGWFRFITDGEVESVAVLPSSGEDVVYLAVKRTINGSTVRYLEKLMPHSAARGDAITKTADAGTLTAGPVSSVTLAHLANETGLVGWGSTGGSQVALTGLSANGSGVISLGATYTNVWVGLSYTGKYKSAKLAYGSQGGTALLQKKRVGPIGLLLERTHPDAISFGPSFDVLDPMSEIEDGTAAGSTVWSVYDEAVIPFNGEWDTDARLCLQVSAPYPATILGIVMTVETSD